MLSHRSLTTAVGLVAILFVAVAPHHWADALQCNCNNGVVKTAAPQCECECTAEFQLPNCDYKLTETVKLDIYVRVPAADFESAPFVVGIAAGATLDASTVNFIIANPLTKFNKTNVVLTMPGYGIKRFLPDVENQELWVTRLNIESAYVIPIPPAPASQTSRFPAFDVQGYRITVEGIMFLVAVILTIFCFWIIESCCCYQNDEETIAHLGYKDRAVYGVRLDGGHEPDQSPRAKQDV